MLAKSVACIAAQSMTDFECFIVDNNSQDDSIARLPTSLDSRFKILALEDNLGFAKANNIAAAMASAAWIACLNPDAYAHPNWLEALLAETGRSPNVTMVGSTQILADTPNYYDGTGDCYHITGLAWRADHNRQIDSLATRKTDEVFAPCAAAALYHKDTFLKLGGFDESFFCYHEDVDLGFRMRLDGGICIQSADAIVDHVGSAITGKASEFSVYHGTRNRIWTFYKNMPLLGIVLFTLPHAGLNIALLFWSLFRPGRFAPTARGILHGLKGLPRIIKARRKVQKNRKASFKQLVSIMAIDPRKPIKRAHHSKELPKNIHL